MSDPETSSLSYSQNDVFPLESSASQNAQEVSWRLFGLQSEKS